MNIPTVSQKNNLGFDKFKTRLMNLCSKGLLLALLLNIFSFGIPSALAATLSGASVVPSSAMMGATVNVVASFTAIGNIPADGKIKITFPAGFDISNVLSADIASSLDGTFTTSISGQILTVIRMNDGTAMNGAHTVTINNKIVNPSSAGMTGTYTIRTTDNADVEIDSNSNVPGTNILPIAGSLTSASVVPASLVADANSNVVVSFTAANNIPADGKIKITFPAGFDISSVLSGDIASSLSGSFTTSLNGQVLTVIRSGGSGQTGARTITIGNNKVKNPSSAGMTGPYSIATTTNSDVNIDTVSGVTGSNITASAGSLTSASVVPASLITNANSNVVATFTATNNIPANGKIKIIFPAGFDISSVLSADITSTLDGTFTASVSSQTLTITRSGGTAQSGARTITIGNSKVQNPSSAGLTGTYTITTTTNTNVVIDSNSAVSGNTIVAAGSLTNASVVPASLVAGASSDVVVSFTATNNIPVNGNIKVTFPTGFDISDVKTADISSTLDGTFTASISGQILTITRSGGTSKKNAQTITISNNKIKNPSTAGTTSTYTIATYTNSDVVIDMNSSVAGTTIISVGTLTAVTIVLNSLYSGDNTNMVVSFTATNKIPANGKIKIIFPAGFDISGVKTTDISSTLDGTFAASIDGQTLTVTRSGGTAQSGTKTLTINNSKVKNPYSTGQTGTFSITTTTSSDTNIDANTAVPGVKIVAAINCAGYSDVLPGDTDCEAFKFVQSIGAMTGNPDGTLNPSGTLQRDQVAKIVQYKTFVKGTDYCNSVNPFPDITAAEWSFQYICKGVQDLLITGYKSGEDAGFYRPARMVNRAEFAALLLRTLKSETIPVSPSVSYSDVPADSWYSGYAKYFKDNDLISGDTFSATSPMSRREVAQIMYKLHLLGKI